METPTYASRADDPVAVAMARAITALGEARSAYMAEPASGPVSGGGTEESFPAHHEWDKRPRSYVPLQSDVN